MLTLSAERDFGADVGVYIGELQLGCEESIKNGKNVLGLSERLYKWKRTTKIHISNLEIDPALFSYLIFFTSLLLMSLIGLRYPICERREQ